MTLSLPVVVGKKYVRRDGVTVATSAPGRYYAQMSHGPFVCVAQDSENRESGKYHAFASSGRILPGIGNEHQQDLVSDYIEPAKGHPHAALMMEFARDAQANADPLSLWQWRGEDGVWHDWEDDGRIKSCAWAADREYRRRPTVTPDPHAENAAEYAKDMALSDKAWEGWEGKGKSWFEWQALAGHPNWHPDIQFRRKEQA